MFLKFNDELINIDYVKRIIKNNYYAKYKNVYIIVLYMTKKQTDQEEFDKEITRDERYKELEKLLIVKGVK